VLRVKSEHKVMSALREQLVLKVLLDLRGSKAYKVLKVYKVQLVYKVK
jgi:hypothetical protein